MMPYGRFATPNADNHCVSAQIQWLAYEKCATLIGVDSADAISRLQEGGNDNDWRNTAVIGYMEDDGALAGGYFAAAEHVIEAWKAGNRNDMLAIPILSLYRHGIELALKHTIRKAAERLRGDGVNESQLDPQKLNEKLAETHSIAKLVQRLTTYLGRLHLGDNRKLPTDTLEVLNSLHILDESGQTFRYSTIKTGSRKNAMLVPARPDQQPVDIVTVADSLATAGTLILHGVTSVLYEYEEYQQYMIEEARGWGC